MARVTIEDCVEKEPNKFKLVSVAARRTHELLNGKPLKVEQDDDKFHVVALREIADGLVDESILEDAEYQSVMDEFRERAQKQDEAISQIGKVDNL